MIYTENLKEDTLVRHWATDIADSKEPKFIMVQVKTGAKYSEAIDVLPCRYTYEETTEEIKIPEEILDNN